MSETKRLLERQSSDSGPPPDTVKMSTIRHRSFGPLDTPSTSTAGPSTKYGTLASATTTTTTKSLLVNNPNPKTYFTKRQCAIASLAGIIFIVALVVTLALGLPRLEQKRKEYFAAEFYASEYREVASVGHTVVVSGSDSPHCATLGARTLQSGNVVDATLATLLCSLIASPQSTGLDSGFSLLLYTNGSGFSLQSKVQWLEVNGTNVSLPLMPQAAKVVHDRFGYSNWSSVVEGSVRLALEGIPLDTRLANLLRAHQQQLRFELKSINQLFTKVSNQTIDSEEKRILLEEGDLFRNPALARTLQTIANSNNGSIFESQIGQQLLEDVRTRLNQSEINLNHTESLVEVLPVWSVPVLNRSLHMLAASGGESLAVAEIVTTLEQLMSSGKSKVKLCNEESRSLAEGASEFHYVIESLKFSSPTVVTTVNRTGSETSLVSRLSRVYESVNQILQSDYGQVGQHPLSYYGLKGEMLNSPIFESTNRNQIVILVYDDRNGDVAVLVTNKPRSLFEGEKVLSPSTGIFLDISNAEEPYREIPTLAPIMFSQPDSGQIQFAAAATGTLYPAVSALAQVLYKTLLDCEPLKIATDESRFFFLPAENEILYEANLPQAYHDLLLKMYGHYNLVPSTGHKQFHLPSVASVRRVADKYNNPLIRSMLDYRQGGAIQGGTFDSSL